MYCGTSAAHVLSSLAQRIAQVHVLMVPGSTSGANVYSSTRHAGTLHSIVFSTSGIAEPCGHVGKPDQTKIMIMENWHHC